MSEKTIVMIIYVLPILFTIIGLILLGSSKRTLKEAVNFLDESEIKIDKFIEIIETLPGILVKDNTKYFLHINRNKTWAIKYRSKVGFLLISIEDQSLVAALKKTFKEIVLYM